MLELEDGPSVTALGLARCEEDIEARQWNLIKSGLRL